MRLRCVLTMIVAFVPTLYSADDAPWREATAYIDAALAIMQQHFLYRDRIDWAQLRRETMFQAGEAQTRADTWPALRFALAKLGDNHSHLQLTPELAREETTRQPKLKDPSAMPPARPGRSFPFPSPFRTRRVPEGAMVAGMTARLAHIVIPQFSSEDRNAIDDYATRLQTVIGELAANAPCGWIVDLRGNRGGNMWAMLAGAGPILGDGEPGASLYKDGVRRKWFYEKGRAGLRNDTQDPYYAQTTREPVRIIERPPVAVLIDRETGSSGEGIAIAFRGLTDTRFFGETTAGAATATFPFRLSDGAQLYLATGAMLDRNGNAWPDGVPSDEQIVSAVTISTTDPVILAASKWLSAVPACQRSPE